GVAAGLGDDFTVVVDRDHLAGRRSEVDTDQHAGILSALRCTASSRTVVKPDVFQLQVRLEPLGAVLVAEAGFPAAAVGCVDDSGVAVAYRDAAEVQIRGQRDGLPRVL